MAEFDNAIEAGSGADGITWKPEEGDVLIGTYTHKKENVGVNGSTIYVVQEDGKDGATSVWGSTVLDTKFAEIPEGSRVKIEFLGRAESKKGRGSYKDFKVQYVPNRVKDIFPEAKEA